MDLAKTLESVKSIKLQGGIFSKSSLIIIVLAICTASVCIFTKNVWVSLILTLSVLGIAFYTIKRCLDFAEKNPQAAIMDGAQFLLHEKMQLGMKYGGTINAHTENLTADHPGVFIPENEANEPDPLPVENLVDPVANNTDEEANNG